MTRNVALSRTPRLVAPTRRASARLACDDSAPVASHVHDLHNLLAQRLEDSAPDKWSARASASFVVIVCGGFWAGVALAVHALWR